MGTFTVPVDTVSRNILSDGYGAGPFYISNVGSVTVYLSDQWQNNPTDGVPLNIGASMQWAEGEPLFVRCANAGTISLSTTVSGLFDPTSIASRINAVGVPTIDIPNVIYNNTNISLVANSTWQSPVFDARAYNSYIAQFSETGAYNGTGVRILEIVWCLNPDGSGVTVAQVAQIGEYAGGYTRADNVFGPYFYIMAIGTPVSGQTGALRVTLSYKTLPRKLESMSCSLSGASGTMGDNGLYGVFDFGNTAMAAAASLTDYPMQFTGPCTMVLTCNQTTTGGNVSLKAQMLGSGQTFAQLDIPPGSGGDVSMQFPLPAAQIKMVLTNGSTTANITPHAILIMTPW